LNFRSIAVRKAPGFRNGLNVQEFDELSPDINVIAGPNGAGKSTTARIIQQLIWHDKTKGLDADGTYELEGNQWTIHIESSYITIQKDGISAQPGNLPPAEVQKVYMLALHELVSESDEDLAKRILDASIGGYDLEAAQGALNYSKEIKKKNAGVYISYRNASERLNEITRDHRELKGKEETLAKLGNEKSDAQNAGRLKSLYEKLAEFLQAKQELAKTTANLGTFPDVLKEASGDEFKRIEELELDINTENANINNARNIITDEETIINGLPLPKGGIDDQILEGLGKRIALLTDIEREIRNCGPEIKELETAESSAKKNIDNIKDPDQWKGIELGEIGNLDNFFQDALTVLQQKISTETEIERLENNAGKEKNDPDKLNNGIRILSEWLKEQKSKAGIPFWIIVLISLLGIISVIATRYIGPEGLVGIPVVLALLAFAFLNRRFGKAAQILKYRQNDFRSTGLTMPERWDAESVSARLMELMKDLSEELQIDAIENSRSAELTLHKKTLERLRTKIDKVNETRDKLLEKLKAMPEFPKTAGDNLSMLYIFLVQLIDWQSAYAKLTEKKKAQSEWVNQRDTELNKCNLVFDELQAGHADDSISAKAIFDKLAECEKKRRDAQRNIAIQEKTITDSQNRLNTANSRVLAVYNKLQIDNCNKDEAKKLMDQYPYFKEAIKVNNTAFANFSMKQSDLSAHPLYSNYEAGIRDLGLYEVQARIADLELKADTLSDLNEQIIKIRTLVNEKKEGGELEDVLSLKKNAEDALENLYVQNLSSVTGSLLVENIKKVTGEQSRPEVFRQADRIFRIITRGKYELRVTDNDGPVFIAYDTVLKQGLDLTEISIGTRVQLLISIRLAFIESMEVNIKLPILADELLANSDDMRAMAIIEALYEICRGGRQIFYFTAKPEEALKWVSFLKGKKDIECKVVFLGGTRDEKKKYSPHKSDIDKLDFMYDVPEPGESTMEDYRKLLKIPAHDLITDNSGQLSISCLTDSVKFFYNCLRSGVRTWGQLLNYHDVHGKIEGLSEKVISEMKNKIMLLEYFQELYRQGRPRPVDMDILLESGTIGRTFIDQVKQKLDEVKGNPAELLKSLPNIPRFRRDSILQLKEFLIEKEYLDENTPLDAEEIRMRLQAKFSGLNITPEDAQNFINRLIT